MSLNLQSFAVFIIIGSFCYLNHIFGLEKYKFAAFGSSLKCKQALLSCYITYAPVVTDKRTDVWSWPSCIYTQIFSPKITVGFFPSIRNRVLCSGMLLYLHHVKWNLWDGLAWIPIHKSLIIDFQPYLSFIHLGEMSLSKI